MINTADAFARARGAVFRIPIEPKSGRDWWWGTGFFISAAGHALTAFHNLPTRVAAARHGQVKALDADGASFLLDFLPLPRDRERDVALLRIAPGQPRHPDAHLEIAALDDGLSENARIRFWAGRAVLVCGFPVYEEGQEEEPVAGHLRGDGPLGLEDEKDGDVILVQVERLRIVPDRVTDLGGISGGPVMDLETAIVVAVEGSCDEDRHIILASELKRAAPEWPEAVRGLLRRLENTPTALRDRANNLLEIPSRPWDPSRLPPGALLRADCAEAVPFHGRGNEQADLEAWCGSDARIGIRLYTAAGGMGKTRLFLEMCERLKRRGWRTGFLIGPEAIHAPKDLWSALIDQSQPLLVVVDYAESRRAELMSLLKALDRSSAGRVRAVLLARAAGDWWEVLKREGDGVGDLLHGPATRWHELQPLTMSEADREASFWTAAKTFAHALQKAVPTTMPADASAAHYDRVLLLHMSALAAIDGVAVKGEQGILNYMLDRERRFWARQVEAAGLDRQFEDGVAQAMTVVTLGGGAKDQRHARTILRHIPLLSDQTEIVRRRIATLLHEAYPGGQWIEPMMPDLLGEHLLQVELGNDDGTLMDLVLGVPDDLS